jgi:hypothetical protein
MSQQIRKKEIRRRRNRRKKRLKQRKVERSSGVTKHTTAPSSS